MEVQKKVEFVALIFLLCVVLTGVNFCSAAASEKRQVMLLNSYSHGYAWTDNEVKGIQDTFALQENIVLKIEYMDTKVDNSQEYYTLLKKVYEKKYANANPDVIISTDDDAFQFLKQYRNELFGEVPMVFCGLNNVSDKKIEGLTRCTGVNEAADFKTNLSLILDLHPKIKEIYVINDRLTTAAFLKKEFLNAAEPYKKSIRFIFLEDLSMDALLNRVASLPKDSVIFYLSFFIDRNGQPFTPEEAIPAIRKVSFVPIYGSVDYMLGLGIVGGMLRASYFQGETAAKMAIRILNGVDVKNLPIVMESPNQYMFDYRELKAAGLSVKDLPEKSILINEPESLFYKYRRLFMTIAVILAGLVCFIIVLLFNIKKRIRAQKGLQTILNTSASIPNYLSAQEFRQQLTQCLTRLIPVSGKFLFFNYNGQNRNPDGSGFPLPVRASDREGMEKLPKNAVGLIQRAIEKEQCVVSRKNGVAFFKSNRLPGNLIYLDGGKILDDLDRDLLEIFANNVTMSIENIEKHKIEESLETARQIQMSMLPGNFTEFCEEHDVDLHAFLAPAKEVGGDLYDFFKVDDDHLCFLVGDVSDKGVPAALFMAMAKSLIRSAGEGNTRPDKIITKANNILSRDNDQGMFVTVFLAIYRKKTRELFYTSAGHNPPYVVSEDKGIRKLTPEPGLVMGAFEDFPYTFEQTTLNAGEGLFIYSDGVTEAMNMELEEYGAAHLEKVLRENAGALSKELNEKILKDLDIFVGQAPQSDDISLLFVRV